MKKLFALLVFALGLVFCSYAQKPEFFKPYQQTDLRMPAVPLVNNDPYFTIWSAYDKLTDGVTTHWTGNSKSLVGLLRVDGTTYRFMGKLSANGNFKTAEQKSVDVLATNTYYTFACGPVELDLVFTAPMVIDNLDLMSTPINYFSYQVRSTDGAKHDVQLYYGASSEIAVNKAEQPTITSLITEKGVTYAKTGTIDQPILDKKGDHICIDWGYFYLPAINGTVTIGKPADLEKAFAASGEATSEETQIVCRKPEDMPSLALVHDFGSVSQASSFAMAGYDEIQDIEYMYYRYKAYWARNGKTIFQAFNELHKQYNSIMQKCRAMDKRIYDDGVNSGDKKYAELLSGVYRHVIGAHKLFVDKDGKMLFFSKEDDSNGCVNTVDLTYPSAPLFLTYNPELQKGMMISIFEYSRSGRWNRPFSAHDIGTYPKANGQAYGGDGMPLEEAGNMLTLAAEICRLDGNTSFVDDYWDILTTWTNYLVENGQDPADQLCTDDFAGHWAHNANLSAKAIMGIAGYALMAKQRGENETYTKYMDTAKKMAVKWEEMDRDGDHYRLAFDQPNTWSQKYNLVWDKLWGINIFPAGTIDKEIAYYLTKQNRYGLPLDIRKDYTKNDWIMWTASMAKDKETFLKFVHPVWDFANETPSRVPLSDWYDTKTGKYEHFIMRSVVGGFWMRVLMDKETARN
jgi:hypothetical protein